MYHLTHNMQFLIPINHFFFFLNIFFSKLKRSGCAQKKNFIGKITEENFYVFIYAFGRMDHIIIRNFEISIQPNLNWIFILLSHISKKNLIKCFFFNIYFVCWVAHWQLHIFAKIKLNL